MEGFLFGGPSFFGYGTLIIYRLPIPSNQAEASTTAKKEPLNRAALHHYFLCAIR